MPLFCPVFSIGRVSSSAISTFSLPAGGGSSVTVANGAPFIAGLHCWAGASLGSPSEYLGKVVSSVSNVVKTQIAGRQTHTGHFLWMAFATWQAEGMPGLSAFGTSSTSGIETLETTGSELIHTRTSDPRSFLDLTFGDCLASDWQGYLDWIRANAGDGLQRFQVSYFNTDVQLVRCDQVKMREPGAERKAVQSVYGRRTWACGLQVVQSDFYVAG